MIEQMRMRDLGVIAEATLPIGPGFTAITGETGAGKTMVVTGLGLLLGQRADSGAVRAGAAEASVDGVWIVPDDGPVAERVREAGGDLEPIGDGRAELFVGRSVSSAGRGRASVGGRAAPAGVLADLADELVVVHGQSDQLRLRSAAAQRDALDRFGGAPVQAARSRYREQFEQWRALDRELAELTHDRDYRAREAADLRVQLAEIEQAEPVAGEDAELTARAERLANAEELRLAAATAHETLSGDGDAPDAGMLLSDARRSLDRVDDPQLADLAGQIADLGYRVADVAAGLAGYLADLDEAGPHELAAVEERRAVLAGLVRSHGSLDAAIALLQSGSARLAELDDDGDRIERLTADLVRVAAELDDAAAALTAARIDAAERLGAAVTVELRALAMPDARLVVEVAAGAASVHGRDDVAILLAPHPGAEPRSVSKGASGGELSRVMLAIEVVIAAVDPVPTFVFDEVDAGIGGAAAIEVGRRLARLAASSQVIAVTHLAQVAAFATNHLSVVKANDGSVTASDVRRLDGAEREAEMARLLSGMPDSDAALTHARELLGLGTEAD
ncbi:DNA repair protein RecN (Recombination protein N) [Microbacterium terrae]|uniref:DNA repair protein RecN n=1 Tax=Microbacterium terrae TaxID=69369 RepID=A0A0M2H9H9_9MICO|nr:DNA repair protein RecN [Microbacterium terrae]KJL41290.1 DNA repair protein RecN [Microbacterium terrae]MBP1077672.1 DNA repair protein RecN (Recombination protein N) [Microbacterium terrae]GLJ99278.1 DNA repair protein RecN [Microbacterium terrae]